MLRKPIFTKVTFYTIYILILWMQDNDKTKISKVIFVLELDEDCLRHLTYICFDINLSFYYGTKIFEGVQTSEMHKL